MPQVEPHQRERAYRCKLFGKLSGLVCIVDRWLAKGWPNVVLYLFRNCIGPLYQKRV